MDLTSGSSGGRGCRNLPKTIVLGLLQALYHILCWTITIVFVPLVIVPLVTPFLLWRLCVGVVSRLIHGEKFLFEPFTFFDTVFVPDKFYERVYAGNITYFVVQGQLSLEQVRDRFCKTVLYKKRPKDDTSLNSNNNNNSNQDVEAELTAEDWQYLRLHQLPYKFGGTYFWKNCTVDASRHIREVKLENGSDGELNHLLGKMMIAGFPKNSALWEVVLVRNMKDDKSVVILRVHHSIADGYSFNRLVDEMLGKRSKYIVKAKDMTAKELVKLILKTPGWIIKFGFEELFLGSNWTNKRKESKQVFVGATTIKLDTLRKLRRDVDCHFAALGMSITGGALRRLYLESHREKELPKCLRMMHLLPKPNHPLDRMCNHWNAASFKIPIKKASSKLRVAGAEKSFLSVSTNHYDRLAGLQSHLIRHMPAFMYDLVLRNNFSTSVVFTSLPGYDADADLWGHPVIHMHKLCGLQYKQTAMAVAVYSHNGQVSFTVTASEDVIPSQADVQRLVDEYVHQEIMQLQNELGEFDNTQSV